MKNKWLAFFIVACVASITAALYMLVTYSDPRGIPFAAVFCGLLVFKVLIDERNEN